MSGMQRRALRGARAVPNARRRGRRDPRLLQAKRARAARQPGQAAQLYMAILAEQPRNADALTAFGELKYQLGDVAGARDLFLAAAQLKPLDPDYLSNLGATLRAQGLFAEAKSLYQRALVLDPACTAALSNWGNLELEQRDAPAAQECFTRLRALEGDTARVIAGLGRSGADPVPKGAA